MLGLLCTDPYTEVNFRETHIFIAWIPLHFIWGQVRNVMVRKREKLFFCTVWVSYSCKWIMENRPPLTETPPNPHPTLYLPPHTKKLNLIETFHLKLGSNRNLSVNWSICHGHVSLKIKRSPKISLITCLHLLNIHIIPNTIEPFIKMEWALRFCLWSLSNFVTIVLLCIDFIVFRWRIITSKKSLLMISQYFFIIFSTGH